MFACRLVCARSFCEIWRPNVLVQWIFGWISSHKQDLSLYRSCVFLRKDLCTADPVSPCAEILRASVHVIPSGSFLRTVQRPWPYLVCCDSQPLARGCARSIRWCGGYAEAVSESGAMNWAFSRVPATGRNGVARQNWGSFWHVCVRCKVLIVANIDQTGKRRKVL